MLADVGTLADVTGEIQDEFDLLERLFAYYEAFGFKRLVEPYNGYWLSFVRRPQPQGTS